MNVLQHLPYLNALTAQATDSLSDLRSYDLDSTNPASVERFNALLLAYCKDAQALVEFAAKHRDNLLADL